MALFHFYGLQDDGCRALAQQVWDCGGSGSLPDFRRTLVILPGLRAARQLRYLWLAMAQERKARGLLLPKMLGLHDLVQKLPIQREYRTVSPEARILRLAELLAEVPLRRLMPGGGESSALNLASFVARGLDDLIRYAPSLEELVQRVEEVDSLDPSLPAAVRQLLSDSVGQAVELQVRFLKGLHDRGLEDPVYAREYGARRAAESAGLNRFLSLYQQVWVGLFEDATLGELALLSALASHENVHFMLPQVDGDLAASFRSGRSEADAAVQRHPSYPAWRILKAVGAHNQPEAVGAPSYFMAAHPLPGRQHLVGKTVELLAGSHTPAPLDARRLSEPCVVECEDPFHEAMAIGWKAAEVVSEGRTMVVAVPTPEAARLVESVLQTWDIASESTYGRPLSHAPVLGLLKQLDELITMGYPYQIVCGLFSHPLCRLSMEGSLREVAWQLEREVVPNERISMGLGRLAEASRDREEKLRESATEEAAIKANYALLRTALSRLEQAVQPLVAAFRTQSTVPEFAQTAIRVLETVLGSSLPQSALDSGDFAVLERLRAFAASEEGQTLKVQWREFLDLFFASIAGERVHEPRNREVAVVITDASQARFMERDLLWLAGLSDSEMPGSEPTNPLLPNDARQTLGLMGASYAEALSAADFARAWMRQGETLFSYVRQRMGTPALRSRFIERVAGVATLLGIPDPQWLDARTYRTMLPTRKPLDVEALKVREYCTAESTSLPGTRLSIWATELEAYLQCPYQFFCRRELGLKPPEEIREVLTAQDLGTLVHDALRAFYDPDRKGIETLPGPWVGGIESSNRLDAQELLRTLLQTLLSQRPSSDLESREMQRSVLEAVPDIIQAEVLRWSEGFVPWMFEKNLEYRPVADLPLVLKARCDRVDQVAGMAGRFAVLDYKTGTPPSIQEVRNGVRPQLFVAALALEQSMGPNAGVEQVHYYRLKASNGKLGTPSHRAASGALSKQTASMLEALATYRKLLPRVAEDLLAGEVTRFPATPGKVCQYCSFSSVCRKEEVVR